MTQQQKNEIEHNIKFLEKELALAEKSKSYTFRWLGKVYTLYSGERTLNELKSQLKPKTNEVTRSKKRSVKRK